ncbi:fatty acid desaturase [Accumulibacter sp.]|jgi:stearoyl-CoA desaturase (delta-9 desaturase)|uniref:DesA family fatty acid desaturase n=1 Tax=Accumulibacter sp. TaxID=2053492 RepID=UPI001AD329FD|nr:fatty acid desaturase [Accumulibacter sp.]MBN8454713.1 fatty acid desaturase [Accumulibacter sp.]MBO3707391.1 fatty acid desaturase [Candidatus Accumulibacter conexus]
MYAGIVDWPWWGYVLVTLGLTHVTIAAVTIFLHRQQAHRALELHPLVAHFFRLWLWLTTGMVTKEWAAIHRKHHARCETAEDPHSPQVHGINRVLWTGVFLYVREARNLDTLQRYGHGTPNDWLERHLYSPWHKLGVLIMLACDVAIFGVVAGPLIWLVQVAWIPFWAAGVINGLGHFWGYRNFSPADASTNISPWGILIGGEELHNNHHTFPTSARLSIRWYEFDIGWLYIRILAALRLAQVKRVAPRPRLGGLRPVVDSDTLQAVIANRYDLLSQYARSLKQVYREELAGLQDGKRFRGLKRWLAADSRTIPQDARGRLELLLGESRALQTAYAMRDELMALWERSNVSGEHLLKALQDWCERAENSGVRQLRELSLRLRSYALA